MLLKGLSSTSLSLALDDGEKSAALSFKGLCPVVKTSECVDACEIADGRACAVPGYC